MLGIVGGVGPLAGIDLLKKITGNTEAKNDQEHLPVILFSFPDKINDRTDYLEGKVKENPGIAIGKICVKLSKAGALVAGIPCNTAHAPEIFNSVSKVLDQNNCSLKIINMIDETIRYIKETFPQKSAIGVMSTTGTYKQKIYYNDLLKTGYLPVVPEEDVQTELVHNSVYHPSYGIKTQGGKITEKAKDQLYAVMEMIINKGVQAIILGCSEIPLAVTEEEFHGIKLIDPVDILAKAMIEQYRRIKHNYKDNNLI